MKSLTHLNGNLLCAIDCETTGLDPEKHDLIQICALPLNTFLEPMEEINPFYLLLQPKRFETVDKKALQVNRLTKADLILKGMDPWKAADLFIEWFENLNLPERKKISPLAQNWPFDRSFLIQWLGPLNFDYIFDSRFRDTCSTALFINDVADFKQERVPFPKVNLSYLASQLQIEHERAHDALQDCLVTANIYKRMVRSIY